MKTIKKGIAIHPSRAPRLSLKLSEQRKQLQKCSTGNGRPERLLTRVRHGTQHGTQHGTTPASPALKQTRKSGH